MRNPPKLVIWDIDGTLVHPSLERQFVSFLFREGKVSRLQLLGRAWRLVLQLPLPPWYRIKLAYLRGETENQVEEWVDRWWTESGRHSILPGAERCVLAFKERGLDQVFLSGTPMFLARRLARHFGLAHVIAGRAETRDGLYTGALEEPHPHGFQKVHQASMWLKSRALNWDDVLALGDHERDALLLARAGMAVAVNPRPALAAEAKDRGWLVVADAQLPAVLLEWL